MDETAVAAFEARIGERLPDDYRAFFLEVNGGRTPIERCQFKVGRRDAAVLNSLYSLDAEKDSFDLAARWELSRQWFPHEVLPIGNDDGGAKILIAIAGEKRAEIWFSVGDRAEGSNPRVEWFSRRDTSKIANSFGEFMASLAPLLEG